MGLEVVPPPEPLPEPSSDERTLAMLCHLSVLFGSLILPTVIFLWKRDSSPFVAYHAAQAAVFQICTFFLASALFCMSFGLAGFVVVAPAIAGVVWATKANQGQWTGYPFIAHIGLPDQGPSSGS